MFCSLMRDDAVRKGGKKDTTSTKATHEAVREQIHPSEPEELQTCM